MKPAELDSMRAAMRYRGPDGCDTWVSGCAGLGQLMLRSTPESVREMLPWQCPESGLVITADARIDNLDELARKLGPSVAWVEEVEGLQIAAARLPDSHYILEAYKKWGEDCVHHILGDFSFVIWEPERRLLFCARDAMGIRPFYYYHAGSQFVFASAALGVVATPSVPRRINALRVADCLLQELEGADKTCSWFEEVQRLPPAHTAVLSGGRLTLRQYWQPDTEFELQLGSDREYTDAFEEVLRAAVSARLRSHQPAACMLSGGLDSSTVVGIARGLQTESGGGALATFSGVSERGEVCRESQHAEQVIEQGGVAATRLRPSDVAALGERLDAVQTVIEDPFDALWTFHQMTYLSARERGHVVVLDGIDGDGVASLTAGYPAYFARSGRYRLARREMVGQWRRRGGPRTHLWRGYYNLVRKMVVGQIFGRRQRASRNLTAFMDAGPSFIAADFFRRVGIPERLEDYWQASSVSGCKTLRAAHAKRVCVPYLTAGVERYGRLAAVGGIEQREPYLDRRVVEFCLSLPWRYLVRDGWSKYGLRLVAGRCLPPAVVWRSDWESVLWKFWSGRRWPCLDWSAATRLVSVPSLRGRVDRDRLLGTIRRYSTESTEVKSLVLNTLLMAEWMERHTMRRKVDS